MTWLPAVLALAGSVLAQDVSQPQAKLEKIRAVNLDRAARLPNFVADEVAVRYHSKHVNPPVWQPLDTIESEISVRCDDFTRQNVRLNGKPWTKPNFPSFTWSVDFGGGLKPLFDPKCKTEIAFDRNVEGWEGLRWHFSSARLRMDAWVRSGSRTACSPP